MSKAASAAKQPPPVLEAVGSPVVIERPGPMPSRERSWQPLPGTAAVNIVDLRNGMCRWPVNDPQHRGEFCYCGAGCRPGSSYCSTHARLSAGASRPR